MKDATRSLRVDVLRIMHIAFCSQTNSVLEEMPPSSVETLLATNVFLDYPVVVVFYIRRPVRFSLFVREGTCNTSRKGLVFYQLSLSFGSRPTAALRT
jgi:hypothetical protein